MILFTVEEFTTYAAMHPDEMDEARLRLMTREAVALVHSVVGQWPVGTTDVVQVVVLRAVSRAYLSTQIDGASTTQASAGPFSQTVTYSGSGGVYLTKADRLLLRSSCGVHRRAYMVDLAA